MPKKRRTEVKELSKFEKKMPDGVYYLYILKCTGGFWYVGVSTNVEKRYMSHLVRCGARFTYEHRPQKLFFKRKLGQMSYWEAEQYEDACALEMKIKYSAAKVGGSHYGTIDDKEQVKNFYSMVDAQFKGKARVVTGDCAELKSFKTNRKIQKVSKPSKKFRRKKRVPKQKLGRRWYV